MILNHKTIEHKLDNGLKILFHSYPSSPSATFMVWYKVGSINEVPGKTGISHFLEHLSFKNTDLFNKGQIASEITRNGGTFNAYTSRDFTSYYESFSTNKLELAMIIESQRMNRLILKESDREKEVGVILSELERNIDNPYSLVEDGLREKAYVSHPYRHPVIGYENDIVSTTLDDLKDYYDKYYVPNNATIVVVGNFDQKQALELIKKHFAAISPGEIYINIPSEQSQKRLKRTKIRKNGSCPIIKLGYHVPSAKDKDIYPLLVLGEMLNLGISSRLYQSLVETQIAIDVNVNMEIAKEPGLLALTTTLFPRIGHRDAEERILDELAKISDGKPPTDEELNNTKRRISSSFEFNKDGTYKLAYLLGYYETINSHKFVDSYVDNIEKITVDDIKRVAKKYLAPSNLTIADFIPSHAEEVRESPKVYDYTPQEVEVHHTYQAPPIIIDEKIDAAPISYTKKILKNGIRVLFSENKTSDTIKLFGTINAGNLYNATVNPALPTVVGGMMNRGSKGRSKIEIASEIETRGASVGISNIGETVNFSLSSTSKDFPFVLDILASVLMEPSFPVDEFEKYKKLAIAGIRQKKEDHISLAKLAFSQMIYPRHHMFYSYSLHSQEKQIKDITLEEIKDFYNTYYSPNTTILGISGNINEEELYNLIERYFGAWSPKEIVFPYIKQAALQRKPKEKIINVEGKTEAEVIFGHYGNLARKDPDFYRATVMNFILGGGGALSSRIGKRIREDLGLVYSISSGFTALIIPGAWAVRFGVDNHYTDLAIQNLKDEIIKFIEDGTTDSELDMAKSYLIGSYPLRFTNNAGIARALLINEFYGLGDDYLNEYPFIISALTKEEINAAAKKYLHPEVATIIKAGSFTNQNNGSGK